MRVFVFILTAFSFLFFSTGSAAWGKQGHRISSKIAEHYMSDDAKKMVQDILGVETLAEASTWADLMRSNPDTFWQRQSMWLHFVTIPEDQRKPHKNGDALSGLKDFTEKAKDSKLDIAERQKALRFLVHIITDLHQPLHAGNGNDKGGNDVKLKFFGQSTNLHRVWDSQLIDHEKLSYTEWAEWLLPTITPEEAKAWCDTNAFNWAIEGRKLHDSIYPKRKDLRWQYIYKQRDTLRLRLKQSGVRLACYLNEMAEQS